MRRLLFVSAACLAAGVLAGCVGGPRQVEVGDITPLIHTLPTIDKSPLHAGVYFSPQFSSAQHNRQLGPDTYVLPIGKASVYLFDHAFRMAFARTSRVNGITPDALAAQDVDVAIAPSLVYFNVRHGFDGDGPSRIWSVAYRVTLYSRAGVPVASWIVTGDDPGGYWFDGAKQDLEAAGRVFLSGFKQHAGPALRAIAGNAGGKAASIDPSTVVLTAQPTTVRGIEPDAAAALRKAGMVPVRVSVQSTSTQKLVVRGSDTRLVLASGHSVEPASVDAVLGALEDPNAGKRAWFLGGILAAVGTAQTLQEERGQSASLLGNELLADRTLEKDAQVSGTVLFDVPGGERSTSGATLRAWVVDPSRAAGLQFDAPLTGAPGAVARAGEGAETTPRAAPTNVPAEANRAATRLAQTDNNKEARLRELKALKEKGLITDAVYRDEQRRILSDTPPAAAPAPAPAAPAPAASGPPPPDGVSLGFLLGVGAKKLSGAETRTVLTSGVIRGVTPNGATVVVSYNPDGTLTGTINGNDISDGKWRIDGAGRGCVDLWIPRYKQTFENLCRHWFMLGDTLYFPSDSETAQDPNARMSKRTLMRR